MKCRLVLLLCLAVSVAAFSETISAKSYYVSPSGSGSQCTLASPCSVTTGLAKPSAGDEVVFLDGTYKQTVYVKKGGSSTAHVVVRALNRHKAVVRVTNGPLARVWANYVPIRGIVFDGGQQGSLPNRRRRGDFFARACPPCHRGRRRGQEHARSRHHNYFRRARYHHPEFADRVDRSLRVLG